MQMEQDEEEKPVLSACRSLGPNAAVAAGRFSTIRANTFTFIDKLTATFATRFSILLIHVSCLWFTSGTMCRIKFSETIGCLSRERRKRRERVSCWLDFLVK